MNHSKQILESWKANAATWVATIDNNEIESRQLATNDAIVKAVISQQPKTVLDLGCGEGWLSRALRKEGIHVWGVDAVQELIDDATTKDGRFYSCLSYEDIIQGRHDLPAPFDSVVINFALIDKEATEALIGALPALLTNGGTVVIQTLHPLFVAAAGGYTSGWKEGSWAGMKQDFVMPYQWYFRTLEDWIKLFTKNGFALTDLHEPVHPETAKPLSIIFILKHKSSLS